MANKIDKGTLKTGAIIVGVGLIGYGLYRFILAPVLEATGLKDTPEEKESKKSQDKAERGDVKTNYWDQNFYKQKIQNGQVVKLANIDGLTNIVAQIYDAKGFFNDNEEAIYDAFRQLPYKTMISQLSELFSAQKGRDLLSFLQGFMNDTEMGKILRITDARQSGFFTQNGIEIKK